MQISWVVDFWINDWLFYLAVDWVAWYDWQTEGHRQHLLNVYLKIFWQRPNVKSWSKTHAQVWAKTSCAIITNDKLYKMKKIYSPKCNFCPEVDNTLHRLYNCPESKKIWTSLTATLSLIGINTWIDNKSVILGDYDQSPNSIKNILISLTKSFLHNHHLSNNVPSIINYTWYIIKITAIFYSPDNIRKINDKQCWQKLHNLITKWIPYYNS